MILTDCKFLVGGVNLSGQANKGTLTLARDDKPATTFGSSGWQERKAGLLSASYSLEAYFDAQEIDAIIEGAFGASTVVTICPTDGTAGEKAYSFRCLHLEAERGFEIGELAAIVASGQSDSRAFRGIVLEDGETVRADDADGTGFQLGAVTSGRRLYAALHVLSLDGTDPELTVLVESDADNTFASATERITFDMADAVGAQLKSVVGPITDTWFRVSWGLAGTDPEASFVVVVGIA